MFFAGKLLALLTQPLGWVIGLLLLALLNHRRHPARSRRLTVCALLVLILIGWQPLPDALIRHLEQQYPAVPAQASLSSITAWWCWAAHWSQRASGRAMARWH